MKQALLDKFYSGEIKTLEPTFDPKTGYHYIEAEAIIGDAGELQAILNKLTEEKILDRKLFDKIIYCPQCNSAGISFRYSCPFCKSFNIKKSSLIEHVKCGYMDIEENFRKNNAFVCPKCNEELRKIDFDYRKTGVWCTCKECGKSFDIPVPEHFCRKCNSTSNFEQAIIKDVFSYSLNEKARKKISSDMSLLTPIRELFLQAGFKVESPAYLVGKSSAKHSFNLAAYKERRNNLVVVDLAISAEGSVSEQPVIALFAKTFDVSPEKSFLVAIPKLNDNARRMAELYNIQTIEAKTQVEAVALLRQKLI